MPKITLNVRDYGAIGDGKTHDRVALQEAIDCAVFGGGDVLVPAGSYVTGLWRGSGFSSALSIALRRSSGA
jgi:polygalacturonase